MKKLLKLVIGSLLLATIVNADDIGFTNKVTKKGAFLVIGKQKTMWYIQDLKVIKENKLDDAYNLLKNKICNTSNMRAAIDKGWTFEYIYTSIKDKKAVVYKIDNCNK